LIPAGSGAADGSCHAALTLRRACAVKCDFDLHKYVSKSYDLLRPRDRVTFRGFTCWGDGQGYNNLQAAKASAVGEKRYDNNIPSAFFRSFVGATALSLLAVSGQALAADPIKIGVIAEAQAIAGASIPQAAQMAAEEINAKGGVDGRKIEIITYDNHSSSADSVRAFQRAVNEDKVHIVIASYISEVVLALEPWASRLKTPFITPGAASNEISKSVHNDYEKNKYTFHGYLTSAALALSVCDAAKELLVDQRHMKTAVIMSEDAAWTKPLDVGYEECLPKIGLKVLDHIRFSPDTTDFTPIFNKIEGVKPDVMITGIRMSACSQPCSGRTSRFRSRCSASARRPLTRRSARTPTKPPRVCSIRAFLDRTYR
jgi:ABC-type branched-subunit amino acid transport system substrate-binding protein